MRTVISALIGFGLLAAPAIASAHPRFEREVVVARPSVVVASPVIREPAYLGRPRIVMTHARWHAHPRSFRERGCR